MASVTFKRGTRAEIEATAKQDGQILMETDQNKKNKMYIDLPDGSRVLIGNSGEAIDTFYDNSTSGLDATNVQNAIDTLNSNLEYLFKMIGSTDISAIGDGTLTGGLSTLNSNFITLTATLGSVGTSIDMNYPTGFNPNNCIVSCAKLELATDVFVSNVYSGETMFEPVLFSSYIAFATYSESAVGKKATIVLKKI